MMSTVFRTRFILRCIMAGKAGRPSKKAAGTAIDAKQQIIDAAVMLIKRDGAEQLTVRKVVEASGLSIGTFYHHFNDKDDLLMDFVKESSFSDTVLTAPLSEPAARICELYMHLIRRYMDLGYDFMKSFYTTGNQALSAYMGTGNGAFQPDTVMARCEQELISAKIEGFLSADADPHELSKDICTIVKGCVFEWCLSDGRIDVEKTLLRILKRYLNVFETK